ncbi:MAG: site-2 protease family protein [Verrucomicrobiales bacterium]
MFTHAFTIGKPFGFPVRIDPSWLLIAALVAWSLAVGYFPREHPDLATGTYWLMGVIGMLGLFVSVLLHELGHALVARRFGLEMGSITLFIFGGVAEMTAEPKNPKTEFWVAVGGPLVTVVLMAIFWALTPLAFPPPVDGVVGYLAFVNTVLLVFNMVPAFPLDGGRVLRAWLWHRTGSLRHGTRIASKIGSGFGLFLIVLGMLQLFAGALIAAIWSAILGLFLRGVAKASYQQVVVRRVLEGNPVRRFMTPNPIAVSPGMKLSDFVEDYLYRHHHKLYPVMEGDILRGMMGPREVRKVDKEEWPTVTVDRVMLELSEDSCLSPDTDSVDALERMQRTGHSRMLVVEEREGRTQLLGVLTLKDLISFLSMKLELEEGEPPPLGQTQMLAAQRND